MTRLSLFFLRARGRRRGSRGVSGAFLASTPQQYWRKVWHGRRTVAISGRRLTELNVTDEYIAVISFLYGSSPTNMFSIKFFLALSRTQIRAPIQLYYMYFSGSSHLPLPHARKNMSSLDATRLHHQVYVSPFPI